VPAIVSDFQSVIRPKTEGRITRLKLIERRMYVRVKLDPPQARLIGAT